MKLKEKKLLFTGLTGSGKSVLAKHIVKKNFKKPIAYKVSDDFDKEGNWIYLYEPMDMFKELNDFCKLVIKLAKEKKIDCVIFDEADLILPRWLNFSYLKDLILKHRHYGLAHVFITRRIQDIPTLIAEQMHMIYCFSQEGDNAIKKLNNIRDGWGDKVKELDYESYKYYSKEIGKEPKLNNKIKI